MSFCVFACRTNGVSLHLTKQTLLFVLGRKRFQSLSLPLTLSHSYFPLAVRPNYFVFIRIYTANPVSLICVAFCRHESPYMGELGSSLRFTTAMNDGYSLNIIYPSAVVPSPLRFFNTSFIFL